MCVCIYCIYVISGQTCKVGDDYKSRSRASKIKGYWYLNVEVPATCSGSIDQYKLRYYYDRWSKDEYHNVTLAIWKPTGGGYYEKVILNYQLKYVNNNLF